MPTISLPYPICPYRNVGIGNAHCYFCSYGLNYVEEQQQQQQQQSSSTSELPDKSGCEHKPNQRPFQETAAEPPREPPMITNSNWGTLPRTNL